MNREFIRTAFLSEIKALTFWGQ